MKVTLKVGTFNLEDGGVDEGNPRRLDRQLDMLAGLGADVIAVQEAKNWHRDGEALCHRASRALGMYGALVTSAHHGCHLALFVGPRVKVTRNRHEQSSAYWHAVACLDATVEGQAVRVAGIHQAPSSPEIRIAEAEAMKLLVPNYPLIAMGDFNAVPLDHQTASGDPRKLDTRAAKALEEAGLLDVGALREDDTPTVGHRPGSGMAYRCDRIYITRPKGMTVECVDYQVVKEEKPTSDHRLVVATIEMEAA
ncbi:endonuclease/exonuclease/phosphatase family protein [Streptosporangium saharense]|uniref:endonuclease/exonuclease/phosphatase family protein n=1 Tax=Streptosporangium saharense TaxID=1706840 RepID=UPI0036CCF3FB